MHADVRRSGQQDSMAPSCLPASFQGVVWLLTLTAGNRTARCLFPRVVVGADQMSPCMHYSDHPIFFVIMRHRQTNATLLRISRHAWLMAQAKARAWS